jgi:3-hydroxyisobutyrate dehydrogenase
LDSKQLLDVLTGGAANSFSLSFYGTKMLKRDFDPTFYVEHFYKDLEIVLDECKRLKIVLPGLSVAHGLYR